MRHATKNHNKTLLMNAAVIKDATNDKILKARGERRASVDEFAARLKSRAKHYSQDLKQQIHLLE